MVTWKSWMVFCKSTKTLDCNGPKAIFCGSCYKGHEERHPHHHVFQVYKVSHYPGIKLKEIEKFYDISDIHPYSFNSKKIIYIRSRPRKGHGNRNHHSLNKNCQECGRELPSEEDVFKFCSIGCKLFNNKGQKFEPKKDEQTQRTRCPIPICNLNFRRRRRKGKPQRAPFF